MPIDWDTALLAPTMGMFGTAARYFPRGGDPVEILDAVFDDAWAEIESIDQGNPSNTSFPMVSIRERLLPFKPRIGDLIDILSKKMCYKVTDVRMDGMGSVLLILNEVNAI